MQANGAKSFNIQNIFQVSPAMARYPHDELEDIFIHPPHAHRICPCHQDRGEIEVSRNISFVPAHCPRVPARIVERRTTFDDDCHHLRHPPIRRRNFQDCCHDCHHHVRSCCCDAAEGLFQFPATYVKEITTTISTDSADRQLDRWFKR